MRKPPPAFPRPVAIPSRRGTPGAIAGAPELTRLIGNLRGFVYRRRHDTAWTMEFLSSGCRDLTGYDPHRFIRNESMTFAGLIAPADRERVETAVRSAVRHRSRGTADYSIRAAHGLWVGIEDRFTPVFDAAGRLVAIEGIIDRARSDTRAAASRPSPFAVNVSRFGTPHEPPPESSP